MIISKLHKDNITYYNVHAEQTVSSAFLDEDGQGIYEEILTISTIGRITTDIETHKYGIVVLDFDRICNVQSNLIEYISKIKREVAKLILINIKTELIKPLGLNLYTNPNNISKNPHQYVKFLVSDNDQFDLNSIKNLFHNCFTDFLILHSKSSGQPIPHFSSSVYLSSYIDIKSMISGGKEFFIYSIYQLALKTSKHWNLQENRNKISLLCQNLNSSYIASILSNLLKVDVLMLDKIGPINKLYSNLDNKIQSDKKYIVVSDLVCLGTEVKITKNLITYLGSTYLGNICIVRIESILNSTKPINDIEYVYQISQRNNPIAYKILTALELE